MNNSNSDQINERIINWRLSCDCEQALNILSNELDSPYKIWFLPSFMKKHWVQGWVRSNRFRAWTKGPRKGASPAIMTGEIKPDGEKSRLMATIKVRKPFSIFKFDISWLLVPAVFIAPIVFITMMVGMHIPEKIPFFWLGFPLFALLVITLFIGLMGHIGRQEIVELESFLNKIYSGFKEANDKNLKRT